ncbi:HIV Tat-specific factor 1 [Tritrichomonas musculus]|uniref:HIV Tat-specific factor 1 n=1 Tax=Tritrichomonas musculus TaxID=1915356 RepID=A0ABR2KFP8_9EUKA
MDSNESHVEKMKSDENIEEKKTLNENNAEKSISLKNTEEKNEENSLKNAIPSFSPANLSVVITDLPDKTTLKQISLFCRKAGVIAVHPQTGDELIIYNPKKHKATVTFSYPEGANHAISLLSGEHIVEGHPVQVERAKSEPFDFNEWKGAMRKQRKFHSYMGEDHTEELSAAEQKKLKVMVLRKVFTPQEMIKDPELYGQIIKDWTEIGSQFGKVTLVKPIEAHPEGVVIVRFDTPQAASKAISQLDDAEYHERKITSEPWDGTDLSYRESEEDIEKRIEQYEKFIDGTKDES